jgi:hypothetical protein
MLTVDEKQQHILQSLQERFLVQGRIIREDAKYYYTADGSKFNKRWYRRPAEIAKEAMRCETDFGRMLW